PMTRGAANPIRAFGSAMITSPSDANEAETPPVVGCVRIERNGRRASASRVRIALVFAICLSEKTPPCTRGVAVPLLESPRIEKRRDVLPRRDREVEVTARAGEQVPLPLLAIDDLV